MIRAGFSALRKNRATLAEILCQPAFLLREFHALDFSPPGSIQALVSKGFTCPENQPRRYKKSPERQLTLC